MKDKFVKEIGAWGFGCPADTSAAGRRTDRADRRDQRHYSYLKKHSPTVINVMRMNGTLEQYLTNLNRDAQEMFELLIKQYAASEGVSEKLKEADQMAWIGKMENIQARVIEVVNQELIYN